MKVFFDTNVYISDALFGGAASKAIVETLKARWKIFSCPTILAEVEHVIRVRFNRGRQFAHMTVECIRDFSELANEPYSRHHVPGDPDDTPILRAALAARVDYLVTRDKRILRLNPVESVRIVDVTQYLGILREHGFANEES